MTPTPYQIIGGNIMNIILKSLHIKNFKGCKDRLIKFGMRTAVKGQNGSGKTTIADAFMWLLFGKDSNGSSNFDIRPKDKQGKDIDFVDIEVKAELEVNGKPLEIIKVQSQKWVKKRGSEEQTFQGNENAYEVNTIPYKEKDFKSYIDNLISEEIFKYVSNTNAFMAMKPMDRREVLFKLVSNITDADVIASDGRLTSLTALLEQFTIEELESRNKKALSVQRKKLEEIPARIDEVSKSIIEIDFSDRELQLSALKEKLTEVENQITDTSKAYEEVNRLKSEIADIKGKMDETERAEKKKLSDGSYNIRMQVQDLGEMIWKVEKSISSTKDQIAIKQKSIERNTEFLAQSKKDYSAVKAEISAIEAEVFDENSLNCPTCGQLLPSEKQSSLRSKYEVEKQNRIDAKQKKLDGVIEQGNLFNEQILKDKANIADLELRVIDYETEKAELQINLDSKKAELERLPSEVDFFKLESIPEYHRLADDLKIKTGELGLINTANADQLKADLLTQKKSIQEDIDIVKGVLASKQHIDDAKDRVEELKEEQRQVSQSIATLEREQYLLEEFNKAKVNLLSEKINEHFKVVKWKLFETQINGGYKPVCEPMVNGQSYSSALNSGHKILAELDIIATLQKIYDVSVPVMLDNAERVNDFNLPEMNCQMVLMKVTEDHELKVEVIE